MGTFLPLKKQYNTVSIFLLFISNGAPLSLFYYTDDGGHYVIDNFEFPCNSVKNPISIWNVTNTVMKNVK